MSQRSIENGSPGLSQPERIHSYSDASQQATTTPPSSSPSRPGNYNHQTLSSNGTAEYVTQVLRVGVLSVSRGRTNALLRSEMGALSRLVLRGSGACRLPPSHCQSPWWVSAGVTQSWICMRLACLRTAHSLVVPPGVLNKDAT